MSELNNELYKLYKMSFKDLEKSEEVYYAKGTTSFEIALSDLVNYLYSELNATKYALNDEQSKQIVLSKIYNIKNNISIYEDRLANALNAEKVTVALSWKNTCGALPMMWDPKLYNKEIDTKNKINYSVNEKLVYQLEDIVVTNDGYKFQSKEGVHIIVSVGVFCFSYLEPEEIIALLMHEFGHAFEHMLINLSMEFYSEMKRRAIDDFANTLSKLTVSTLLTNPGAFISKALSLVFRFNQNLKQKNNLKLKSDGSISQKTLNYIGEINHSAKDRDLYSKNIKMPEDQILFNALTSDKAHIKNYHAKPKRTFFTIFVTFVNFIYNISEILFSPFKIFLDPKNNFISLNKKFLNKELRYEQFADRFATIYGYGPELASALEKSRAVRKKDNYYTKNLNSLNFVYYIPIVNLAVTYSQYLDNKATMLLLGYPMPLERTKNIYETLNNELKNNKNLSAESRIKIESEMIKLKEIYSNSLDVKSTRNIVYTLFYKLTRSSIEKSHKKSTKIYKNNVLDPIQEIESKITQDDINILSKEI